MWHHMDETPVISGGKGISPEEKAAWAAREARMHQEWEVSAIRGWYLLVGHAEEVRVVERDGKPVYLTRDLRFAGELVYMDKPEVAVSHNTGGHQIPGTFEKVIVVGKATTYRGIAPAWTIERRNGRCVWLKGHCRTMDTSGLEVPLEPWCR